MRGAAGKLANDWQGDGGDPPSNQPIETRPRSLNLMLVRKKGFEPSLSCENKLLRQRQVSADRGRPRKPGSALPSRSRIEVVGSPPSPIVLQILANPP